MNQLITFFKKKKKPPVKAKSLFEMKVQEAIKTLNDISEVNRERWVKMDVEKKRALKGCRKYLYPNQVENAFDEGYIPEQDYFNYLEVQNAYKLIFKANKRSLINTDTFQIAFHQHRAFTWYQQEVNEKSLIINL